MSQFLIQYFEQVGHFAKPNLKEAVRKTGIHSGNVGDVIYSLPTCRALGVRHLYLNLCVDPTNGGRSLTESMCTALVPLLLEQDFIDEVTLVRSSFGLEYVSEKKLGIDINLDRFRLILFRTPTMHIAYAHALAHGIHVDINEPWISLPDRPQVVKTGIIANLTSRYRRYDREFYERLLFGFSPEQLSWVGLPDDQLCRAGIPGDALQYDNFLEFALAMKASSGFIGNASFPYALAESLKVKRIVETHEGANVFPVGKGGEILHQLGSENARELLISWLGEVGSRPVNAPDPENHSVEFGVLSKNYAELQNEVNALEEPSKVVDSFHDKYSELFHAYEALDLRHQKLLAEHEKVNQFGGEKERSLQKKMEKLQSKADAAENRYQEVIKSIDQWGRRSWWTRAFHKLRAPKK